MICAPLRAVSSVGRASRLHREGQRFEPVTAHHFLLNSDSRHHRISGDDVERVYRLDKILGLKIFIARHLCSECGMRGIDDMQMLMSDRTSIRRIPPNVLCLSITYWVLV